MANSFLHPRHEVHYDRYQPSDAEAALNDAVKKTWEAIDDMLAIKDSERTFANTVLAYTRATELLDGIVLAVFHLDSVLGGAWRQPKARAAEVSTKLSTELILHEGIYHALKYVSEQEEFTRLPATHQRLLRDMLREYRRNGIELPPQQKEELKRLSEELTKQETAFEHNLADANKKAGVLVRNRAELNGLDEELISSAQLAAEQKGEQGYWIAYSEPNYINVMSSCTVAVTRSAMAEAANTRAARTNTAVAQRIIQLRQQLAALLGYGSFADYELETRMVGSSSVALNFINQLIPYYHTKARQEAAEIVQFAREYEKDDKFELGSWEVDGGRDAYYANLLRQKKNGFDESRISEYFPLAAVRQGMFGILAALYDIRIEPAPPSTSIWHPDVEVYDIYDQAEHHLARVWCDWLSREGKNGGAWMGEQYVADRADGSFQSPHLGYVITNFPAPTKTKPNLLTLHDVETMWHEFGHFMHFAFSRTSLKEQSSLACKWDFIEAPSQIMENWVWQPEVLQRITRHYKTNDRLPEDVAEKIRQSQNFRVALKAMRQFYFASLDLRLHTTYDPSQDGSIIDLCRSLKQQFSILPVAPYEADVTNFSHIFAGGYSAGYYSYKWAEAIQADLFSRFQQEGIINPAVGTAYKNSVLSRGDEVDPQDLIRDFLGRESTSQAMLEHDGVAG